MLTVQSWVPSSADPGPERAGGGPPLVPIAVACGRPGLSQGGGDPRDVKLFWVESTEMQEATGGSASTYHLMAPAGTVAVSELLVDLPMTLNGPPPIEIHTLYCVAVRMFDQVNRTGETTVMPSGGRCSRSGPLMSQVL